MVSSDRAWRPFWLHQAVEYLLGLILIAQGLQGTTPAVPALAGALIVANAAIVDGPLGAFRAVSRRQHRVADLVVIAVVALLGALPFVDADATSRVLLVGVAAGMALLWWTTSFERRVDKTPTTGTDVAGVAGRLAGRAARAVRDRTQP
ncbi:MAG: hypothetical protein ACK5OX_05735 [Desertimonas sp.]